MITMAATLLTPADLATELGTTPKITRSFLRADYRARGLETPGKGSRWAIERKDLRGLKGRYTKWAAAQAEARAARAQAAAQAAQEAVDTAPEVDEVDETLDSLEGPSDDDLLEVDEG
jgi:hypothetical protein